MSVRNIWLSKNSYHHVLFPNTNKTRPSSLSGKSLSSVCIIISIRHGVFWLHSFIYSTKINDVLLLFWFFFVYSSMICLAFWSWINIKPYFLDYFMFIKITSDIRLCFYMHQTIADKTKTNTRSTTIVSMLCTH
jgi:phosphate starvation-inducible membrane PsiE